MAESIGDSAQVRKIAEQVGEGVADVVLEKFIAKHPEVRRGTVVAEIPPPLKWAGILVGSAITLLTGTGLVWIVTSVSEMSVTLARMDERMGNYIENQTTRMDDFEGRLNRYSERLERVEQRVPE